MRQIFKFQRLLLVACLMVVGATLAGCAAEETPPAGGDTTNMTPADQTDHSSTFTQ